MQSRLRSKRTAASTDHVEEIKLLRFDQCPQLADLKSWRLYVPAGFDVPEILRTIADADLDEATIEAAFDELVRLVTTSRPSGKPSASFRSGA